MVTDQVTAALAVVVAVTLTFSQTGPAVADSRQSLAGWHDSAFFTVEAAEDLAQVEDVAMRSANWSLILGRDDVTDISKVLKVRRCDAADGVPVRVGVVHVCEDQVLLEADAVDLARLRKGKVEGHDEVAKVVDRKRLGKLECTPRVALDGGFKARGVDVDEPVTDRTVVLRV